VSAEPIVGLTPINQIFSFDSGSPGTIEPLIPVTGLVAGTQLVGIVFRPATPGTLVGVGVVFGDDHLTPIGSNVYTIDTTTGVAVVINTIPALLAADVYGVDFNPVVNALRIVNAVQDQNLRIVAGGTGAANVDTNLNPGSSSVVGAAYSNNVAGATATTLYDIDHFGGGPQLVTQGSPNGSPISPNTGTLFPVGPLGVSGVNPDIGFDISASTGMAFASLAASQMPAYSLYTINLGTGAATLIGPIDGPGFFQVLDIAVSNAALAAVPAPGSLALLGIGAAALLARATRSQRKRSGAIA
jgi:hypothetical protein